MTTIKAIFPASSLFVTLLISLSFVLVVPAHATLIDRGFFNDGLGGSIRLIFDDDLNITWLGDANFSQTSGFDSDGRMSWFDAILWVGSLTVGGFTDWRLPEADPPCGEGGSNCVNSEMGHLFYLELGGTAGSSIFTSVDPDLALFINLQDGGYHTGTEDSIDGAWDFDFDDGQQGSDDKTDFAYAWAVRDGDVGQAPIPEPSTMMLFGTGLAGLISWQYRKKHRK